MSDHSLVSGRPTRRRLLLALAGVVVLAVGLIASRLALAPAPLSLQVQLGSRAVSKLPFLIAADQDLFQKHGVEVDLRMPLASFDGARGDRGLVERGFDRLRGIDWEPDVIVNGATPEVVGMATNLNFPPLKLIASTDCVARSRIIGRHGLEDVSDLKGKRIGVTSLMHNLTGFVALELARRMGWDPELDISIVLNGADLDDIREGRVDAIVGNERRYAESLDEGFPILLDTRRDWGDLPIGGNSVRVTAQWLEDPTNQEAARRLLKALVEGVALFHEDRELALDVLQRWNGYPRDYAEIMYDEAAIPRVPFPCYDGIRQTMDMYDSHGMRDYSAGDFYDDRILRELEESGFIEEVYSSLRSR